MALAKVKMEYYTRFKERWFEMRLCNYTTMILLSNRLAGAKRLRYICW